MSKIKILIAGDFCAGKLDEGFDYAAVNKTVAEPVRRITEAHDISVVNVETVFSDNGEPIKKDGGNIKSHGSALSLLKNMNFTIGACANNHFGDFGEVGVEETLANLHNLGMLTVGAGENEVQAQKPLYLEKDGIKIALINCAEHEYGIAKKDRAGAAGVDYYITGNLVKQAKKNADKVIVYMHGGNEHNPLPRPGLKKLCHFLSEQGADAVILAHSHCPLGSEIYNHTPIIYGMGNFYFPSPKLECLPMWEKGYMVSLTVERDADIKYKIIPYIQHKDGKRIEILQGEERERFGDYVKCISNLLQNEKIYDKMVIVWSAEYVNRLKSLLEEQDRAPHSAHSLYMRNTYTCESHSEVFATYYEAYCENRLEGLEKYKEMTKKLQRGEIVYTQEENIKQ